MAHEQALVVRALRSVLSLLDERLRGVALTLTLQDATVSPAHDAPLDLARDYPELVARCEDLRLEQVLINLLGNAVTYTAEGEVAVEVSKVQDRGGSPALRFEVTDTGPGIPAKIRERLFEPFVTFRPEESEEEGARQRTGLGLYICRDLVESAGGTIHCESVEGEGATFHITLPRAELSAAA